MEDKYILQKDLPDGSLAGDIYAKRGDMYYNVRLDELEKCVREHSTWFTWQVEKNTDWFQKSKQHTENKDWEIVCVKSKKFGDILDISTLPFEASYWLSEEGKEHYSIFSVRRLSDNSVWSVGDKIDLPQFNKSGRYSNCEIKSFRIRYEGSLNAEGINGLAEPFSWNIIGISKQRTPLFTTDDTTPVPVYEGDKVWILDKYFSITSEPKDARFTLACIERPYNTLKTFSTEQAAKTWILYNKKELSLNDLLSVWGDKEFPAHYKDAPLFKNFENLVKQKIKQ